MKKFLSILLSTLMVLSATVVFADNERPDRIMMVKNSMKVVGVDETTVKADTNVSLAGTTIEIDTDRHTSFGQTTAIVDGVGMVGSFIDNDTSKALIANGTGTGTAVPTAATRWVAKSTNVMPTFTVRFTGDKTFNEVRWTEARRIIGSVELDFYKDDVKLNETPKTATFSDIPSGDDNNVYLRKVNLGENVTADKVVIRVTGLLRTDKNLSITEMEFGNSDVASVSVDMNRNTSFGTAESMFDGIGMIGSHINNDSTKNVIANGIATATAIPTASTRWVTNATNVLPTFTVEFTGDRTFSEIRWTEARQVVGTVEVKVYRGNEVVFTKTVSPTSYEKKSDDDNFVYLKTADIGKKVTGDKVEIAVKTLARTDKNLSITEMEFGNKDIESISVDMDRNTSFGTVESIFDGKGMVGTNIDNDSSKAEITNGMTTGTAIPTATTRWVAKSANAMPTFTVKFTGDRTFSEIRWTEARQVVGTAEVKVYRGNEVVFTKTVSPTSYEKKSDDDNFVYLRTADLGAKVTGDRVEIAVKTLARTDKVMSITEMEFWNGVSKPSIVDANGVALVPANNNYTIDKAFDGILNENTNDYTKFLAVAYVPESEESENYVLKYELPITISFDLGTERTFNYAQLNELRCAIGEIDVYVSSNGTSFDKIATMPQLGYDGDTSREYIHSISFDSVTARYVKFVITEMATFEVLKENGTAKGITISEISVHNFPTIASEVIVYPIQTFGNDIDENTDNFKNASTHMTVNNTSESTKIYSVFGVSYKGEHKLVQVRNFNLEVVSGKQRTINISAFGTAESNELDIFVWDAEMAPYIDAVTLKKIVTK